MTRPEFPALHVLPRAAARTRPLLPVGRRPDPVVAAARLRPSRLLAALAIALLALLVVGVGATPADAHASLVSTDPADGEVVADPPDVAGFVFNEPVSMTTGALRVFDATGARVDDGVLSQPAEDTVGVGLASLADGGYVATYRVTSDDGHVIRGAVTFRVGTGAAVDDVTVASLFAGDDGVVSAIATVARGLDLGAALVAIGALVAAVGMVTTDRHRRIALDTTRRAAVVGLAAAAVTVPLQAMASSGLGLAALGSVEVLSDTVTGTVGVGALTRIVGLVLALAVVQQQAGAGADARRDGPAGGSWTSAGAGLLVLGSLLLDGHTRTVAPMAVMVVGDAVHVVAGAIWAGGLVVLARILFAGTGVRAGSDGRPIPAGGATDVSPDRQPDRQPDRLPDRQPDRLPDRQPAVDRAGSGPSVVVDDRDGASGGHRAATSDDPHVLAAVVATFSGWALWSMLALVVAGSAMGWALVRQPRALVSTDQGWTLVAKVGVVAVILLVAAWNRWRLVPAIVASDPDRGSPEVGLSHLRSSLRVEVVLLAVVLALTAVLVGLRPAAEEAGISGAFDTVAALGDDASVNLVVDPNRAGRNQVHLYVLDATGRPVADATDVTLVLEQVEADIGPLQRTPRPAGPGHWILEGSDLAVPGRWEVTAVVGVDRFTQVQATVEVVVNPR